MEEQACKNITKDYGTENITIQDNPLIQWSGLTDVLMPLDPKVADCVFRCPNSRSRSWRLALPITIPLELSSDKKSLEGHFGTAIW